MPPLFPLRALLDMNLIFFFFNLNFCYRSVELDYSFKIICKVGYMKKSCQKCSFAYIVLVSPSHNSLGQAQDNKS